ncbi:MAG: hypothetical protein IJT12_06800 [Paludibacteraceae bacterium]|nr:hypothetical protein [Paludibacteraceae bacterium]
MKKIYSYVLMAAMMLLGTSAWADNFSGTTRAELQAAIDGAATGTTLVFQNNVTLDGPVWLGTENLEDASKSITLDLNGHNVSMTGTSSSNYYYMFVLTHGELLVRNSNATTSQILLTGSSHANSQIFSVYGSYKSSRWNADGTAATGDAVNTRTNGYFSHLEIGKGVNIVASEGCLGSGIVVDQLSYSTSPAHLAAKTATKAATINSNFASSPIKYFTSIHGSSGYAYGARVDVYGNITIGGIDDGGERKAYGIKTNGNLSSPLAGKALSLSTTTTGATGMNKTDNNYLKNYDANKEEHKTDTLDAAYVYVHDGAKITTNANSTRSAALYCSGYAKWMIEGECKGGYGVYVASGEIGINDATIASTSETYNQPSGGNGATGSGTAIVINSKSSYPGDISVTISGNTEVSATNGYAIEETVTSASDTKVDNLNITGGSFEGGEVPVDPADPSKGTMQGTITISVETAESVDEGSTSIVVAGGVTIEGGETSVTYGNEGNLGDIIDGSSTYMTTVTDPETGKQTVVVSSGSEPVIVPNEFDINLFAGGSDVNLSDEGLVEKNQVFNSSLSKMYINTLQINPPTSTVTLTITAGKTIQAKNILLGGKGKIIVEPGAQLIVSGGEGVVSLNPENLVLQTSATQQAKFLIDPEVDVNAHPKATVEFVSTRAFAESAENYQSERFAIPTHNAITSIECTTADLVTNIQLFDTKGWKNLGNLVNSTFANISQLNKPFAAYTLLPNNGSASPTNATYRFTGELTGNMDATLTLDHEFTPFANSYSADLDVYELMSAIDAEAPITAAVYVQVSQGAGHFRWDAVDEEWFDGEKLTPLQPFVLHNESMTVQESAVDYADMVWAPATGASPAPARRAAIKKNNNTAKLRIVVSDNQGECDNVKMTESATQLTNAPKYMNDDVNFYAHAGESKLAIMAAEDLEDTYLGFSTVKGGEFTISFANADGREFDLIDLETGARVEANEGQIYTFSAAKNTNADYRFKLVERKKVITDVDKIGTDKKAQGIYTIMGQYVGEMNLWNTLPAGVYVVDGTKRVK